MAQALARHPEIAAALVTLFFARFDPDTVETGRGEMETRTRSAIAEKMKEVESLDDDRILTRFLNLIDAMVRTNFFQKERDGRRREAMAFKFESSKIDGLPLPHPLFEIFVYSPRLEGVHLRFGRVARGGIRWSDRPQDFRTEVLGLVKAQQVKNAVIVPVGAKGASFRSSCRSPRNATRGLPRAPRATSCSSRRCSILPTISTATGLCIRRRLWCVTPMIPIS